MPHPEYMQQLDADWCRPALEALYLTGPTASGKTPLALQIAQRINAEIISLDSMAIYRGMDIGTAKPSLQQRTQVTHHMLDVVEPNESYSLSCYVATVHKIAAEIRQRGRQVLFVGGTPLYLKALIRGLFLGPPANAQFRADVEADVARYGHESLRDRLMQVDPLSAHKLHVNDQRRMIRALEVAMTTGKPLSHWQTQFETPSKLQCIRVAVLGLDRAWLHERINARVERMLAEGLEEEVRGLIAHYGPLTGTAGQAVGYKELQTYLSGNTTYDDTVDQIKAHTRQFARRQEIWFRSLRELVRFELTPATDADKMVNELTDFFTSSQVSD